MALQGGDDLFKYRPYEHPDSTNTVGHHRGENESLNVQNAQPGFKYYYSRTRSRDIIRLRGQGWEVVRAEDPEIFGTARLPDGVQNSIDGLREYQDVVLMRMPVDRYEQLEQEKARVRAAQISGLTDTYLEEGENRARAYRGAAPSDGRPLYYARAGHGITQEDI